MLYHFKEYAKYVEITGYKNVRFSLAEEFLKANRKETQQNSHTQFFNAQLIATQQHLYFAVLNALEAFKNKTNISKSLAMETMLYASAQRQIQKAIQRLGIRKECADLAVVIIGESPAEIRTVLQAVTAHVCAQPDESVLEMSIGKAKKIQEAFGIKDEEVKTVMKNDDHEEAVVNLIIERAALLATQL